MTSFEFSELTNCAWTLLIYAIITKEQYQLICKIISVKYKGSIKQQQPPWNYIGEEAIPCPEQNGDNEWCNNQGGHR